MTSDITRFDRAMKMLKNNRAIAAVLVAGSIIIAIAQFTNAFSTLLQSFTKDSEKRAEGVWSSGELKNFAAKPCVLVLDLHVVGKTVVGSIKYRAQDGSYFMRYDIQDGRIEGNTINFYQVHQVSSGDSSGTARSHYVGIIDKDRINFNVSGFISELFAVERQRK